MPQKLPFFHDVPQHRYRIALDGVQYEVRLTYRERPASWYLDLWDENGEALLLGKRLSPNVSPTFFAIPDGPPGVLVPFGADPYARDEIELWYYSEAEAAAARPTEADLLPLERHA